MIATRTARCRVARALAVFIVLPTLSARAEIVDTAQCRAALDDANRLMRAVQERQMQFAPFDGAQNCRLLRENLADLTTAREPIEHCLIGNEHTTHLNQIDAAIEQIRVQLIGNCRR